MDDNKQEELQEELQPTTEWFDTRLKLVERELIRLMMEKKELPTNLVTHFNALVRGCAVRGSFPNFGA